MNVVRDANSEQLLDDSKRVRERLVECVDELSLYLAKLQEFIDAHPHLEKEDDDGTTD